MCNVDVRMKLVLFEVQKFHFTKTVIYIKVTQIRENRLSNLSKFPETLLLLFVGLYFVVRMILYVGVFYSNVKPMETITTVLREKWCAVGMFCC